MSKTKFVCDICGATITGGIDEYVKHVKSCAEREKKKIEAEKNQEHLNNLNAAINKVKQAKAYYENCLEEFKGKYPKEYDLNFGDRNAKPATTKSETKPGDRESTMSLYDFLKMCGMF